MHIPDEMLSGVVCPVGALVAVAGLACAVRAASRAGERPSALRFAAVAALVFAGQMVNFPVLSGTSGHLLGGVLASSLLGMPFGVLAVALVVTLQALVFADGGLLALGANVFNMALMGAGLGGLLQNWLWTSGVNRLVSIALASGMAVLLSASACSFELAASGTVPAGKVLPAMLGAHALIGLSEAAITVAMVCLLDCGRLTRGRWNAAIPLLGALLIVVGLSPFASSDPDGLESVAERFGFLQEGVPFFVAPLANYEVALIGQPVISGIVAGLAGVALTMLFGWGAVRLGRSRRMDPLQP